MVCHISESPGWHQAIVWPNPGILLIGPLGTKFSEILIEIYKSSLKKNAFENVVFKMAAILSRPQCVNTEMVHVIEILSPGRQWPVYPV